MNDQARKALELARAALEWPAEHDADVAIAAIDAALNDPAAPVTLRALSAETRVGKLMKDPEFQARLREELREVDASVAAAPAAPVAQPAGRLMSDPDSGHVFVPSIPGDWSMLGKDLYTSPQPTPLALTNEAAPDLLEALRECLTCEFPVTDKAAIFKAEAAIAKATGDRA